MKARGLRALLPALLLAAAGCFGPATDDGSAPAGPYGAAAQYSREHAGLALLVYKGGQLVFQEGENGGAVDRPYLIFSGTKSFACATANVAIQDGLLTGLDDVVSSTITEWASVAQKSAITVRQLLSFTDGIEEKLLDLFYLTSSQYGFLSSLGQTTAPGSTFQYGEIHISVFAELMRRKLLASGTYHAMDPLAYLKARVLDPIGLQYGFWLRDPSGQPLMSFGAGLAALEWLKYGILVKDHGSWNGSAVLNSARLDECFTGSTAFAGYGLNFWLNVAAPAGFTGVTLSANARPSFVSGGPGGMISPAGPSDLVLSAGLGDNRMYISRSLDLVVVRVARASLFSNFDDAVFFWKILNP